MSVQVQTKVFGLAELDDALRDLRREMAGRGQVGGEGNLTKNALSYAARTSVKPRMIANAPEDTGRLRRSIFHKLERNPHTLSEVVYVGPRLGRSRADETGAWYAAIVEFKGGRGGRGKGYMRRAIKPDDDVRVFARNLGAGIARVAKRIGNENLQAVGAKAKAQFK